MGAEKIPEADPDVLEQVEAMLDDPNAYLRREREASLRSARAYVDGQVTRKLIEQESRRSTFGQRLLRRLRSYGAGHPHRGYS